MRISDWSSDVCSSDLAPRHGITGDGLQRAAIVGAIGRGLNDHGAVEAQPGECLCVHVGGRQRGRIGASLRQREEVERTENMGRSEEHTSELQSLMRNSYAVFCLKKKKTTHVIYYTLHKSKKNKKN